MPRERLELSRVTPQPPQDCVSTNFTTAAFFVLYIIFTVSLNVSNGPPILTSNLFSTIRTRFEERIMEDIEFLKTHFVRSRNSNVPQERLGLSSCYQDSVLNTARLPISPLRHCYDNFTLILAI